MKKRFVLLACVAAMAVMLLGCGGKGPKNDSPKETEPITEEATTSEFNITPDHKPIVAFGNYEWNVLDQDGDKCLITSRYGVSRDFYNTENIDVTWETCTLRHWLNNDFLAEFTAEEQANIALTHVINADNAEFGTSGGNDTDDYIFLLSYEEADRYYSDSEAKWNGDDNRRCLTEDGKKAWWWLRSTGKTANRACFIGVIGTLDSDGQKVSADDFTMGNMVRPAMWVNTSALTVISE